MKVLGINYIFHDSSACLLRDGEIAFAIEEERLSRQKHTQAFPARAIAECLKQTRTNVADLDHIAVSINPGKSDALKLGYAAKLGPRCGPFLEYEFKRLQDRTMSFWAWYHSTWPSDLKRRPEVHFVDHHDAHAAGSYFVSQWSKAALLSIDGWGEWSTTWTGVANDLSVEMFSESHFPNSLGMFYSAATEYCGFQPNYDEGKTMGLAPTGDSTRFFDKVDSMVQIGEDATVGLDLDWFDFPSLGGRLCGARMLSEFGPMRGADESIEQHHRDVAAAFQAVLEKNILTITGYLAKRTGYRNLVFGGGVALNSVTNGKILRAGHFDDIFVMPGAGDNGTAIGAAAFVHSQILGQTRRIRHSTPFLGRGYSNEEIRAALEDAKLPYYPSDNIVSDTAKHLHEGKIVGWFQGRMEFGPRALGGRSILADPTDPDMKRRINAEVTHREAFRPFAPAIIESRMAEYFETKVSVPYMLVVAQVRQEMRAAIPAIVHVDGSARLQTVERATNPKFHDLIEAFGVLSGHPVVLNTSFNVNGEPIVESPKDALRCFFSTGLDVLAIGDFLVYKDDLSVTKQVQRPAAIRASTVELN